MNQFDDLISCLISYEDSLLSTPWKNDPSFYIKKIREITDTNFVSIPLSAFEQLRKLINLHTSYYLKFNSFTSFLDESCNDDFQKELKGEELVKKSCPLIDVILRDLRREIDSKEILQLKYDFAEGIFPTDIPI